MNGYSIACFIIGAVILLWTLHEYGRGPCGHEWVRAEIGVTDKGANYWRRTGRYFVDECVRCGDRKDASAIAWSEWERQIPYSY